MVMEQQGRTNKQFRRRKGKLTLKKLNKKIKELEEQPESKIMDFNPAPQPIDKAGIIVPLTSIAQGDTQDTRTGSKIMVTSSFMRLYLEYPYPAMIGSPVIPDLVRLIVFRWKSDSVPTVADILEAPNALSSLTNSKSDMIKVIYDNSVLLNPQTLPTSTPPDVVTFNGNQFIDKFYKKLNLTYKYTDTADLTPNLNQLYILSISQNTDNYVNLSYFNRVRFLDS